MTDPDQYDRFTRGECNQKHDNKCIDVIYGWKKKEGKEVSEVQALRYSIKVWEEDDARAHCKKRGGTFEAAKKSDKGGKSEMKDEVTKESFKGAYPDIFQAILAEGYDKGLADGKDQGKKEGAESERKRIQEVEAQLIPGHEKLIATVKYDGKTTGPEAALKILAAEKNLRSAIVIDLAADAIKPIAQPASPVADGDGIDPNLPVEEKAKQRWDKSPAIRDEFNNNFNSYLAWMKADEAGYARILKKGGNRE
jgi:hypothetical protein